MMVEMLIMIIMLEVKGHPHVFDFASQNSSFHST